MGGQGGGVWPLDSILHMQGDTWTNVGGMPVGRYGHGCATYLDRVYVSGGYSDDGRLGRVDVFNPGTKHWTMVGDMVIQRNYHQMLVVNNILTVVGGYGAPKEEYWAPKDVDTIEEYHPDIDRWVLHDIRISLPRRSFGVALIQSDTV